MAQQTADTRPAQTIDINGQPWLLDARVCDREVTLAGALTADKEPINCQSARVHRDKRRAASADGRSDMGVVHVLGFDEIAAKWRRRTVVMFRLDEV